MADGKIENEDRLRKWIDTGVSSLQAIGIVASIYFGFHSVASQNAAQIEATDNQRKATENQTKVLNDQWSHRFYDEQLSIYGRATEAAARIVVLTSDNPTEDQKREKEKAITQFQILFAGPMCISENDTVETAMEFFNRGLNPDIHPKTLEQLSFDLAHICRNEAHKLYSVPHNVKGSYDSSETLLLHMRSLLDKDSERRTHGADCDPAKPSS